MASIPKLNKATALSAFVAGVATILTVDFLKSRGWWPL